MLDNLKEDWDSLPKWLKILIGVVLLEKLFKKGLFGKALMLFIILAFGWILFIPLFWAYMIPQSGIEYETFELIIVIVIGALVIGCTLQYMIEYDTPPEGKKPPERKRMYPKNVTNMRKGRGYLVIADYICGNCGHKNTAFSDYLHFAAVCSKCGTENVIKLKWKEEK
ncbi:MAG: hypothetical protein PVF58_00065 [Candidatus Methanofastidiosia archaeon]|jgi:hypothetical protein